MRIFFLFLLALLLPSPALAGSIALVLGDDSQPYEEFSTALREELANSGWHIVFTGSARELPENGGTDLIIAAGSTALRDTLALRRSPPLLATLLPRGQYESILAAAGRPGQPVSAIYLDQPAARQAAFLAALLPGKKRFGVLSSTQTRNQLPGLRTAFERAKLGFDGEIVEDPGLLLPALEALLLRVDALLALPDTTLYQRKSIKPLLITAYRYQRPVIAFSTSFVRAGALAALYATPQQIARQIARQIKSQGTRLPPATGPEDFSISINTSVSEALGLQIADENSIHRALRDGGDAP